MLRRIAVGVVLAVAAVIGAAGTATAALADRVGATFAEMVDEFIEAAQPMEGIVLAVEGETVYIDLAQRSGARVGQELTVFRRGDPFYHPFTRKVLGHHEDVLGWAQIRRVGPEFSEAVFIPKPDTPGPRPEDGVRISRARVRIAITPVLDLTESKADVRRVPYLLGSILERSRRFQVVDPFAVRDMFASGSVRVAEVLARPQRAVQVARNLEVTGWLVPVLIERRGVTYLDVTWVSAITGTALLSRRLPLVPAAASAEQRFPWEPRSED